MQLYARFESMDADCEGNITVSEFREALSARGAKSAELAKLAG